MYNDFSTAYGRIIKHGAHETTQDKNMNQGNYS